MSLSARGILDPRWVFHHRGVASSMQVCDVNIFSENLGTRTYDPETNTWDTGSTLLWTGKARIQPTKISSERTVQTNATFVRQVIVQIDFAGVEIPDIRPGHYLLVSSSPYDATLEKFVYIVRTIGGSSNPWQRTLTCEVDMEADPDA